MKATFTNSSCAKLPADLHRIVVAEPEPVVGGPGGALVEVAGEGADRVGVGEPDGVAGVAHHPVPGFAPHPTGFLTLPDALEPLNDTDVDADLWALLRWTIAGVGGEWRVEDLDATGRLYQLSVAASA